MPEPQDDSNEPERDEHEHRTSSPRRSSNAVPERHRGRGREGDGNDDDPRAHALILGRRWLGSAPPTAELYADALRQWQALPGAVRSPATSVAPSFPPAPASQVAERDESTGSGS